MARESIIWTALPHGTRGSGANQVILLSVFGAPRLDPTGTSGTLMSPSFPEFADWTARVAATSRRKFRVFVRPGETGTPIVAGEYEPIASDLRPDLWRTLLSGIAITSRLDPRLRSTERLANAPISTFRDAPTLDAVRRIYQNAAFTTWYPNFAEEIDEQEPILDGLRALRAASADGDSVWRSPAGRMYRLQSPEVALESAVNEARTRRDRRKANGQEMQWDSPVLISPLEPLDTQDREDSTASEPAVELMHALAFHDQHVLAVERDVPTVSRPGPSEDFHQLIAALGSYPDLLRQLGLIFELEVPVSAVVAGSGVGYMAVQARWNPVLTASAFTTWTRTDRPSYWPLSSVDASSPIQNGFLVSATGTGKAQVKHLEIVPISLDGSILQLAGIPANEIDAPEPRRLPVVRFGGLGIVQANHAAALHRSAVRALEIETAFERGELEYDVAAEDITRGYRVDVWSERAAAWRSLHAVNRAYQLPPGGTAVGANEWTVATEGFATMSAVTPAAPGDDDMELLLTDEMMLRWRGWSLSATPPGKSVDSNGELLDPADAMQLRSLKIRQAVQPRSLPQLRFGDRYRLRLRTVDLAGNSPPPTSTQTGATIDPQTVVPTDMPGYLAQRYESLEPPVVVPRAPLQEGESVEHLVLRSTSGADAEAFAQRHPQYIHSHERHIAPPKTTAYTTELHGMLNAAFGATASSEAVKQAYAIAARDSGSLDDPIAGSTQFIVVGPEEEGQGYTIHTDEQMTLPYLPDPLTRGAVLRNMPGVNAGLWGEAPEPGARMYSPRSDLPGSVTRVGYGAHATWPEFRPFRLELFPATSFRQPKWDAAARLLQVGIPPGELFTVGLRHSLDPLDLPSLGVWTWGEERLTDLGSLPPGFQDNPQVRHVRATAGDYWFTTPERRLTLLHAVQKPVRSPTLTVSARRSEGQTFAELDARLGIHARSTARIDLTAAWTDKVDPVNQLPHDIPLTTTVRTQEIAPPVGVDDWLREGRDNAWTLKGTIQLTAFGAAEGPGVVPSALVSPQGGALPFLPPDRRAPTPHEFGDTKHRWVRYQAIATTRFRDYFPADITDDPANITQLSREVRVNVLSSARPIAPHVRFATPAFRWNTRASGRLSHERQRQGGIRIYLDRPWFSSGDEEKLAVVLWAGDPAWPPPSAAQSFVTRWGRDPIWQTPAGSTAGAPQPSDFPARLMRETYDTFLGRVPGPDGRDASFPVAVAVHDVDFHDDGRCSCDIQLAPIAGYLPFARLAIARFQPHSEGELHLSPITLTDFIQLTPNRQVTLAPIEGTSNRVRVSVTGVVTGQSVDPAGQVLPSNTVEVSLERRIPGATDDLGWEPIDPPAPITPTPTPGLLWHGDVTLPTPAIAPSLRLVLREFDHLVADAGAGHAETSRLVFADTVELRS